MSNYYHEDKVSQIKLHFQFEDVPAGFEEYPYRSQTSNKRIVPTPFQPLARKGRSSSAMPSMALSRAKYGTNTDSNTDCGIVIVAGPDGPDVLLWGIGMSSMTSLFVLHLKLPNVNAASAPERSTPKQQSCTHRQQKVA